MNERDKKKLEATVPEDLKGLRADRFLADHLKIASRSQLKSTMLSLTLNGKSVKPSKKVNTGDLIQITYTLAPYPELIPENIPLQILYEDENVIVIDKPQGMVVHPAHGHYSGTLVQGLLYHCSALSENFTGNHLRPGVVHRLDKDTSGVIIAAKTIEAHEYLSEQFRKRKVKKQYIAVIKGRLPVQKGEITASIARDPHNRKRFTVSQNAGKPALTRYKVIRIYDDYSLVLLYPKTGRTHQLRVHLRAQNTPVLGDPLYSRKDHAFPGTGLMLHSFSLTINIPGKQEKQTFRSQMPDRFHKVLKILSRDQRMRG